MKKLIILSLLIVAGQVAAWGQTVNIHMKDGSVLKYDASGVDYVNFTAASTTPDEHEAVDLGLPSGLKWATCNVGATKPEEGGGFYAWGEVAEKDTYDWKTYKWCEDGSYSKLTKYNENVDVYTLEPEDDAAHVLWGGSWRMPTREEFEELLSKCTRKFTTQNEVRGLLVTGPNGNSIFLPFAGYNGGAQVQWTSNRGYWWTRNGNYGNRTMGYAFYSQYDQGRTYVNGQISRDDGLNIRPVTDADAK